VPIEKEEEDRKSTETTISESKAEMDSVEERDEGSLGQAKRIGKGPSKHVAKEIPEKGAPPLGKDSRRLDLSRRN